MDEPIWTEELGDGPLAAAALHAGHEVRAEVAERLALGIDGRLREQDPHTDEWTVVADTRVVGRRSRFEVDLNRPRDRAVYLGPDDAWGLNVWKSPPEPALVERSLAEYDRFYARMREILSDMERRHGRFVVLDLHSYNQRRGGPDAPAAEAEGNPQVNLGTGTMDRARWSPLVDRFLADLRACDFPTGPLDVRENVRFRGGHFPRWVHEQFPASGCVLAVEFKKFFMDEWTGLPERALVAAVTDALRATVPGLREELRRS